MPSLSELSHFYGSVVDLNAAGYRAGYSKKKQRVIARVLKRYLDLSSSSVTLLELGPGPLGLARLMNPGSRYIAVEPSQSARASLQQICEERSVYFLLVSDITELQDTGNVDVLFSNATLEHVPDPLALLSAAVQQLRPEGLCVVGVPDRTIEIPYSTLVHQHVLKRVAFCSSHLHSFSSQSLHMLFQSSGLRVQASDHLLKPGLLAAYRSYGACIARGIEDDRLMRYRWFCELFLNFLRLSWAKLFVDRRGKGDDRGEMLLIGIRSQ